MQKQQAATIKIFAFIIALLLPFSVFFGIASAMQGKNIIGQAGDMEIVGEVEVIHADDFEHPENSRYFFYLIYGNKRYELQSEKDLPVVLSGTVVRLKGEIVGDKIVIDSSAEKPFEIVSPPAYALKQASAAGASEEKAASEKVAKEAPTEEAAAGSKPSKAGSRFNLNWLYAAAIVVAVVGFLLYLEVKRRWL